MLTRLPADPGKPAITVEGDPLAEVDVLMCNGGDRSAGRLDALFTSEAANWPSSNRSPDQSSARHPQAVVGSKR